MLLVAVNISSWRSAINALTARCGIGLLTKSKSQKNLKTLQNGVFGLGVQWDLAGSRRNCVLAAAARFPADAPSTAPGGQSPGAICSGVKYHRKNRTTGGVALREGLRRCVLGFFLTA